MGRRGIGAAVVLRPATVPRGQREDNIFKNFKKKEYRYVLLHIKKQVKYITIGKR